MNNDDYKRLGLMCGLEIHYQLNTKKKLFCNCPVGLRNDPPDAEIIRHMRPTLSELGEYDGTALMEFKTKKEVHYLLYYDTVCTYEMDDTPPFLVNEDALNIVLEIALLLNCQIADEIHVSRKQYLDGSIPTGFQRTIAVGVNGWIPFRDKKIRIMQLCLEEDACREISDQGHIIVFRTDRLSIPLVEVITHPDIETPEEAAEVDRELGRILRSTGKIRRGIGTVRQDVNVSIRGGARVEIKGVPKSGVIKNLVHYEAIRQRSLLFLKEEIKTRGISINTFSTKTIDCTEIFAKTKSKSIAEAIKKGAVVGAIKICGFAGLLNYKISPNRTFADDVKGRIRVIACLDKPPILFHSDAEAEDYSDKKEWQKLTKALNANYTDSIAIVWGENEDVNTALSEIAIRIKEAIVGIPSETRQVLTTGETDFERILPGPNRMYPDTDSAPIPISNTLLEDIKSRLPHSPEYWRNKYKKLLNDNILNQLIDDDSITNFDEIYTRIECEPNLIAHTLVSILKSIKHDGDNTDKISNDQLIKLFEIYKKRMFDHELIPEILIDLIKDKPLSKIIEELSLKKSDDNKIRATIQQVVKEYSTTIKNREKKLDFLIGRIKNKMSSHVSGKKILQLLNENIERRGNNYE